MVKMSNVCRIQYSKSCENRQKPCLAFELPIGFQCTKDFFEKLSDNFKTKLVCTIKLNRHGLRMYKYISLFLTEIGKIHELFILFYFNDH